MEKLKTIPMTSVKNEFTHKDAELLWLQLSAGLIGLVGIGGLIALLSQGAFAADASKGFQAGGKTFSNPFANPPTSGTPPGAAKNNFFEDDEEDEAPASAPNPVPAFQSKPTLNRPNPTANRIDHPTMASADPSLSMGGNANTGVVQKSKIKPIQVDMNSGEGSKEIVTDFNFPDADILDIAKTLGKLTGKNFILDKDVKGRVTIISNSAVSVADAWKAFLTALDINGFALLPSGNYIRIMRATDARDKQVPTFSGDASPNTDALITRIFPLKYISAEEVARTFRNFMPSRSRIVAYDQTNTVIVTDTGSNTEKLNKILELLDVEGFDAGIEVIPVKYASATELSKLIDTLIPGTGGAPATPGGAPRFGGGSRFSARRTKEGGIINTIISDERTNTLIVHANTRGADQVRELVAKLDQKQPAQTGGGKVHVVYLQFAEAEQIANTLNNLSSSSSTAPKSSGASGGTGVNPVAGTLFEGSIRVSPDKATNSLVITAAPSDFVTVQRVISRLDIPRDEVFVEAIVMEVSAERGSSYSASIASIPSRVGSVTSGDLTTFLANPAASQGLVIPFSALGETTTTIAGQSVKVPGLLGLIKAIQSTSKTNVLATPQIIALDNTEAVFESTDKIPVPVSTAIQGAGVATSIQKENVTLSIKIKPQINKMSNFVKLDTEVKLGDISGRAVPQAVAAQAFATLDRSAKTTVVVGDGDTLVIGGLIRDKITDTTNKIPILGDIPILGWLFKSKDTKIEKNNLLIFLTPHIVRQYEKVRAILDRKLQERDEFIEKNAGGDDPLRPARDNMIRNLPDIKELTARKPENTFTIDEEQAPKGVTPVTPAAPSIPAVPEGAIPGLNSAPLLTPPVSPPSS